MQRTQIGIPQAGDAAFFYILSDNSSSSRMPYRFFAEQPARPPPAQAQAHAQAQLLAQAQ